MKTCFNGGADLAQELRTGRDASFNEGDHPRDSDGKFGSGGSSPSKTKRTPSAGEIVTIGGSGVMYMGEHGAHARIRIGGREMLVPKEQINT